MTIAEVTMKRITVFAILVIISAGCQKHNEPLKTMFSGNARPSAGNVEPAVLKPGNPTVESTMSVVLHQNIRADSITWYVNNGQVLIGDSLHGDFKKGDTITAAVAYQGKGGRQKISVTPAVVVHDAPPVVTSIVLAPLNPTIASTIHATVQASDPDGDQVSLAYQWYVNGNPIQDQTGDSFSCESFQHGNLVYVMVTPSDGEENGVSRSSSIISIQDTPPVILSQPRYVLNGSLFSYQVRASDIDNDTLQYRLESGPPGMTISSDGLITWDTAGQSLSSTVTVKIVVDDGQGGKAYQTFQLGLERKK